jgi:hypothetical protein
MTKADPDCLRLAPGRRLGSIHRLRGPVAVNSTRSAAPQSDADVLWLAERHKAFDAEFVSHA